MFKTARRLAVLSSQNLALVTVKPVSPFYLDLHCRLLLLNLNVRFHENGILKPQCTGPDLFYYLDVDINIILPILIALIFVNEHNI